MSRHPDRRALLAKAHIGRKALGLDDAEWVSLLQATTGVDSCSQLDAAGLARLLDALQAKGVRFAPPKRAGQPPKALGSGSDRAALLGKVEALLADASRPWEYVHAMARRMYQKDRVQFCDSRELIGLVTALTRNAQRAGRLPGGESREDGGK